MTPPGPSSEDAREHLWNAAHEFLKAMRVQRIDIDDAGAS